MICQINWQINIFNEYVFRRKLCTKLHKQKYPNTDMVCKHFVSVSRYKCICQVYICISWLNWIEGKQIQLHSKRPWFTYLLESIVTLIGCNRVTVVEFFIFANAPHFSLFTESIFWFLSKLHNFRKIFFFKFGSRRINKNRYLFKCTQKLLKSNKIHHKNQFVILNRQFIETLFFLSIQMIIYWVEIIYDRPAASTSKLILKLGCQRLFWNKMLWLNIFFSLQFSFNHCTSLLLFKFLGVLCASSYADGFFLWAYRCAHVCVYGMHVYVEVVCEPFIWNWRLLHFQSRISLYLCAVCSVHHLIK